MSSKPFSARTLPPPPIPAVSLVGDIIEASREKYALSRAKVEQKISEGYRSADEAVSDIVSRRDERSLSETLVPFEKKEKPRERKQKRQVPVEELKNVIRQALKKDDSSEG